MRLCDDGLRGGMHVRHVGITRLSERRRHGNRDRIGVAHPGRVSRGHEAPRGDMLRHQCRRDVLDVRVTGVQQRHHALTDVKADHPEARLGEFHREGQADVAEADDRNDGVL
jgi:hypothetical protein